MIVAGAQSEARYGNKVTNKAGFTIGSALLMLRAAMGRLIRAIPRNTRKPNNGRSTRDATSAMDGCKDEPPRDRASRAEPVERRDRTGDSPRKVQIYLGPEVNSRPNRDLERALLR
jgi:hypothetical protein